MSSGASQKVYQVRQTSSRYGVGSTVAMVIRLRNRTG
jgi:hypothetical protein